MFRKFLVWLNGGELDSHTEPVSRLDRMDGVHDSWSVEPSAGPEIDWRGI